MMQTCCSHILFLILGVILSTPWLKIANADDGGTGNNGVVPYKPCFLNQPQVNIRLSTNGHCLTPKTCNELKGCTVLHGSLILRRIIQYKVVNTTVPDLSSLQEITGYLVITFFAEVADLLPSLTVIRGNDLVGNYAFVVYFNTYTKFIYFPNLTTILNGGVRVSMNKILCYVGTVRWKSIVKDKEQKSKYGIVVTDNNDNCDSACYPNRCYAGKGHGNNPKAQFCWGPGTEKNTQCQRFCDSRCDLQGCVTGTSSKCCHSLCLGGCSRADDPYACSACLKYRVWSTGLCVNQCPVNTYLVDNLFCKPQCPGWSAEDQKNKIVHHFVMDSKCVEQCPAGYIAKDKTCKECSRADSCPKVCILKEERLENGLMDRIAYIRVPSDIVNKGLAGCTEIIGSLSFEIPKGTGKSEEYLKNLELLRKVRGHISIKKTSFRNLNFLSNLEIIDPPKHNLLYRRYALQIYENELLETLWAPSKKINVTNGRIFAQYNDRLCPREIFKVQKLMHTSKGENVTGDISTQTNGNRVFCDVERLEISVEEIHIPQHIVDKLTKVDPNEVLPFLSWSNPDFIKYLDYLQCLTDKCMLVQWQFKRDQRSSYNIIFYQVFYRKLKEEEKETEEVVTADVENNLEWKNIFVERPTDFAKTSTMEPMLNNLTPFARYAVFVREVVSKGEARTSRIHYLRISPGIPTAPVGLEASFLSSESIHLKWNQPDQPNGIVNKYIIYWQPSIYSFWKEHSYIEWCKRDNVKSGVVHQSNFGNKKPPIPKGENEGQCLANNTCVCSDKDKPTSEAIKWDRDNSAFRAEFGERINKILFTKERSDDEDDNDNNNINETEIFNASVDNLSRQSTNKSLSELEKYNNQLRQGKVNLKNVEVTGDIFNFTVNGLQYFQDYEFHVCACTEQINISGIIYGGCAKPKTDPNDVGYPCAIAQARTDAKSGADALGSALRLAVEDQLFNITWLPPVKPNAVVLKYDVEIKHEDRNNDIIHCRSARDTSFSRTMQPGTYYIRARAQTPAGNGSWSEAVELIIEQPEVDNPLILPLGVGISVLFVILVILIVYYAFFRRNLEKDSPGVLYASVNPEYMNSNEVYVPDEWELNRETIELLRELGQGSFGMVYEGIAHDINGLSELRVAVKTVNENATIRERIEFLQEASIMKAFNTNHVVRLIGVVSQGQPTFVVMELMAKGDLKNFLRSRRPEEKNPTLLPPLRAEILQMAAEIADGMAYLAARKYVHRDLAARNCMVAVDFTVKIGDFGMARDIYETDYYRKGGKGLLPVRWMAPESLRDGIFTTASDVWSFGVVLWEVATLAAQPYQGKSNEEVLKFILAGGKLEYPSDCDKRLQQFMEMCWSKDPKMRPSFLEIVRLLEDDVSEDFVQCSFYHEMKKKALEDTLCQEGNLYELLARPLNTPLTNSGGKLKRDHSTCSSDDSGAFIESCKNDADQTPTLERHDSFHAPLPRHPTKEAAETSTPLPPNRNSLIAQRQNSAPHHYDNINDQMRYGASPVAPPTGPGGKRPSTTSGPDAFKESREELKLSKIFGIGKGVPV